MQENFNSLYGKFILNLNIIYELNDWSRNNYNNNNFSLNNCLFGTVRLVRNIIKNKFTYNGRGIAFDGEGM